MTPFKIYVTLLFMFDLFPTNPLQDKYNSLRAQASLCCACPLSLERDRVVFGAGCLDRPLLALVGEAPIAQDEAENAPFSGWDGKELKRILQPIQDKCYFTNAVLCKPPNRREALENELHTCAQHLTAQLNLVKPKSILLLGSAAVKTLLALTTFSLETLRKDENLQWNKIPVAVTYHLHKDFMQDIQKDIFTFIERISK